MLILSILMFDYLAFGDFTALEVLIGRGGAPAVRLVVVLPFGTAPLLSTLLGGVGAQDEVEEWEWECLILEAAPPVVVLPVMPRESREEARVSVCGGLSWWQSQEHSSGLTIFVPFGLRIASL